MKDAPKIAPTPSLSQIQQLALARIQELEKEIDEQYGLKIRCGIELEWFLRNQHTTHEKAAKPIDPLALSRRDDAKTRKTKPFGRSNIVELLVEEQGAGSYEISLGRHEDSRQKGIGYMSPAAMARATQALKKNLLQWKSTDTAKPDRVRLWARDPRNDLTSALQVNVSLYGRTSTADNNHNGYSNLFTADNDRLYDAIEWNSLRVQKALFPCVVESTNSLARFDSDINAPRYFGNAASFSGKPKNDSAILKRSQDHGFTNYCENRLPGADADPFLSTLMSVGGIYMGLKQCTRLDRSFGEYTALSITLAGPSGAPPASVLHVTPFVPSLEDDTPERIPTTLREYEPYIKDWGKNELASEILGEKLHRQLTRMRTQQFADMQKGKSGFTRW